MVSPQRAESEEQLLDHITSAILTLARTTSRDVDTVLMDVVYAAQQAAHGRRPMHAETDAEQRETR